MNDIYVYEKDIWEQGFLVLGTDEVGRGPMAGPLVAASVVLPNNCFIEGINDSKKLSPKKRDKLFEVISNLALDIQIAFIDEKTIDKINVYQASKKAMLDCISKSKISFNYVLSDAMPLEGNFTNIPLIKGDQKSASIAAASIIAKVTRDRYMIELDALYPQYAFKKHKGYVTKEHLRNLEEFGPCCIHRLSYSPVANIRKKYKSTLK
ncbi:MAG: ribonuclease HII [Bacilli bacterium]|nr:ribonuclease HII [Bacilli bacterium]